MWRAARLACAKKSPPFRDVFCFGFHHHCSKNGVLAHSKASWQWRHHPLDAKVVRRNSVVSVPFSAFLRAFSTAAEAVVSEDETAANASALEEEFRQITVQNGAHRRVNGIGEGRREINGINGHGFKENGGVLAEDEALNEALAVKQQEEAARIKERNKERALRARQMRIETQAWQRATKEYQELAEEMCASNLAPSLPYMKSLFLGWFEPLRDTIADEQKAQATRKGKTAYGDYLMQLPPDMLAVITMHKTVALLMTGRDGDCCARVVQAVVEIGEAVEHEAKVHRILERTRKKGKRAPKPEEQQEVHISKDQELLRQRIAKLMKKHKGREVRRLVQANAEAKSWGKELQAKVGSVLLELLIQTAFIQPPADQNMDGPPEIRPAFKHTFRSGTKEKAVGKGPPRRYGVIECDPLVKKGLERTARHMVIPYMPMLVKPLPWRGYDKGAYLFLPSYVMRIHGARKQRETMKNVPKQQMAQVYKVLDILGSTKWRVNKRVLNVVDRLWSEGGGIADLVSRNDVPYPEKPETEDGDELKRWRWRMRKVKKENSELYSQRCDVELKLSVARKMRDEKHFYYPHNVDFRGRAYPMHPYLNHLGSDMCRGLLEFAEGRKLGKAGLTWLKIHAASLFGSGVDKLSLDGRLAFVEDNIGEIFESAEHPLEGNRFWMQAEDPFQFLAICMNLYDALNSPNPEDFVCYTPVHQDGSCNGLQHYAALGRDKLGAEAVNLTCGNKPADVYSGIAARVLEIMQKDAVKDVSTFKNAVWAKALVGQVDRKLVKQTVMTSVYGVTYIGAREQIKKRLKERGIFAEETDLHNASCYCAKVTLTALGEMFKAARSIMSWLGDCAKIIAHENATVRWTTPLGLPVVQPYQKYTRKMVRTSLQVLALQSESNTVMAHRQRSAFPPNFVHSLDSSHMMMTALSCNEAGLTFAGVHDSYWTHAADVETMNRILREKFVELYKKPILEDLLQSFQTAFPNLGFPPLPDRGDFELEEVLNSPYFFN